jgi:hypothetical protein
METVAYLVEHVGRRFGGSSGEHEAAHYLAAEFRRLGLNVWIERFRFMGWELHEIPRLKILKPEVTELPCAPYIYSSSTPEGGLEGKLEFRGPEEPSSAKEALKYVFFDDQSEEEVAYVVATRDNVSRNGVQDLRHPYPVVAVAADSTAKLSRWTEENKSIQAHLTMKARFNPEAVSTNVIAELPGTTHPESVIIVTSHHDTQLETRGANDDASGIAVELVLAADLARARPAKTVRFCVFGVEELGMYGSRYYVQRLKETGELRNVEMVLCLDEIGQAKQPHRFRATNEWLLLKLQAVLRAEKAEEKLGSGLIEQFPMKHVVVGMGSDHAGFVEEGVPAISIGGGGYSGTSHTGTSGDLDTIDRISPDVLSLKAAISDRILRDIAN